MFEILTVCTGNICRSPLAQLMLAQRLGPLGARVTSAGTRGLNAAPMTPEAVQLAVAAGIAPEVAAVHRSRFLTEQFLTDPDLILAMTRDHRRHIAELAPARLRSTFTIREFARLSASIGDAELRDAADAAGPDATARVRAAAALVASFRGIIPPPDDPIDDDVIDPYGRSWQTYEMSAAQLTPGVEAVVRVVSVAVPATA